MKTNLIISQTAEDTKRLGKAIGETLPENAVLALYGDLGAGKTTFIRGLVEGIGVDPRCVCSPTFNFLNIYEGNRTVYHFDLYRLPSAQEFFAAGFEEYLSAGGICCIEWAEKLGDLMPQNAIRVTFSYTGQESRSIEVVQ